VALDVIAERRLQLSGGTAEVIVTVGRPISDGNDYRCDFKITGLGYDKVQHAMGVDSVQALLLALMGIGARLYTSDEAREGRLTWLDSRNLGFPVPDNIADLVPED